MAFQVSPGVNVREFDLTGIVPAVSTSIGGYAGRFSWGPADELINVVNEKELSRYYGTPEPGSLAESYFTASAFLRYSNALIVSRAVNANAVNASSGELTGGYIDPIQFKNIGEYENIANTGLTANFYARYPGEYGNSIKVMLQPAGIQTRFSIEDITVDAYGEVTLTLNDEEATASVLGVLVDGLEIQFRDIRANGDFAYALQNTKLYLGDVAVTGTAGEVTAVLYTDSAGSTSFDASSLTETDIVPAGYILAPIDTVDFEGTFITQPGTSDYAAQYGVENDEIHVLVIDEDGKFSGTPGTILERYENLSVATDAKKENGETSYYKTVINRSSNYIVADNLNDIISNADVSIKDTADLEISIAYTGVGSIYSASLTNGSDGTNTADAVYDALDLFDDPENVDVNFLFAQNDVDEDVNIANKLLQVCENRKDCLGFVSPDVNIVTLGNSDFKMDSVIRKFNKIASSSYLVFDSTPVYVYDKYNDQFIWTPACGHIAGLCANTDAERDPWWSPAGYNRGQLLGVMKLGFNPKQNQRDELYKSRINPIVQFPGEGIVLFGDKTALAKPSAFDRINVRRLFITLEKAISVYAKYKLFEFNDEFTRARFVSEVEPYLRDVQSRRGITDFRVICDETNNTGEVIDSNRFVGDIYIKPNRSINFITLNFIATRTGVEFEEVIGQFG
jgi:phage tail sheath protein FI